LGRTQKGEKSETVGRWKETRKTFRPEKKKPFELSKEKRGLKPSGAMEARTRKKKKSGKGEKEKGPKKTSGAWSIPE